MLELFSDFDRLVPSVELLIHSHRFLDFIVLNKDCFCLVELLVQDCELGLHPEVVRAFLGDQLVKLAQVVCARHVA